MKLLYIVDGMGPVFSSQVYELVKSIEKLNIFEEVILCIGTRKIINKEVVDILSQSIKIINYITYPMYPGFNYLTQKSLVKCLEELEVDNSYIIHVRNEFTGRLVYNASRTIGFNKSNILVDVRGAVIEEILMYGSMNPILKFFKLIKYKKKTENLLKNIQYINCVSDKLKKYLINTYNANPNNITVIPTISGEKFSYESESRRKTRNLLKIKEDEVLFVFSTSSAGGKWQNGDEIANTLIKKGYKVLMLTRKKYDNPNIISAFVDYSEVPNYLMAADIGIIIRNDDIVNNVASPIKFCEYLSCGLPIVSNKSVDLINKTINGNNNGVLLDDLSNLTKKDIDFMLNLNRNNISTMGNKTFGIGQISMHYAKLYKKMQNKIN